MLKNFKKVFIFLLAFSFVFAFGRVVLAVDSGLGQIAGTGLGITDPRVMVANVIRIFLGFLGVIALFLILYAGFLWTTSAGDPSKIDKAKKILVSAVVGLLIILSAFAIASFIIKSILGTTTGGTGGTGGGGGGGGGFATSTLVSCNGGTAPACVDNGACNVATSFCDAGSGCTCQPLLGLGASCNATTTPALCIPSSICVPDLTCNNLSCVCSGAPIIDWVSPVNISDEPNGAVGDFITIEGRFFGTTTGQVYFTGPTGWLLASSTQSVNAACINNWTKNEIIVVVPAGAINGPIRVVRQVSLGEDVTNNSRGPILENFVVNMGANRPGICSVVPNLGSFTDPFTVEGAYFTGPTGPTRNVYFGNITASTTAIGASGWGLTLPSGSHVNAEVPNVRGGRRTIFIENNGAISNNINYRVVIDTSNAPIIHYIDPPSGPPGEYITIFGSNFGNSYNFPAQVLFASSTIPIPVSIATDGFSFPVECQNTWWQRTHIIVPVPSGLGSIGGFDVTVTNINGAISSPESFEVTTGLPGPGICALDPHNGPVGTPVDVFGQHFGTIAGEFYFYNMATATTIVSSSWADVKITDTIVPAGALTGTTSAVTITPDTSNYFPFRVGVCTADTDCYGGEECCGGETYWDGVCRTVNTCNDFDGMATTTGYGWTFNVFGTSTPADNLTCSGWSGGNACLVDNQDCPNSPGECLTDPNPVTGTCGNSYCSGLSGCFGGNCAYDSAITSPTYNRCIAAGAAQITCEQISTTTLPGYNATCDINTGLWQVPREGSCPTGSYLDSGLRCIVGTIFAPSTCYVCDSGFSCFSGQCVKGGSVCNNDSTCSTSDECIGIYGECECCCEVIANDCCLGLTCESGGCGSGDPLYGQCTGCRIEDGISSTTVTLLEQSLSDATCNCPGTTGKSCIITDLGGGVVSPSDIGYCDDTPSTPPPPTYTDCDAFDSIASTCVLPTSASCPGVQYCDSSTCTCREPNTYPGAHCIDEAVVAAATTISCDPTFCTGDYSCLNGTAFAPPAFATSISECGICCCDPTIPDTRTVGAKTLTCYPDKGHCTGTNRGLYCGCELDSECAAVPDTVSCGDDTCCHSRPQVIATSPADEVDAGAGNGLICRNTLIEATFDTEMDIASFKGNVILFGDYVNDPCPAGSQQLVFQNDINNKNIFVKTFANIKNKIISLVFGEVNAFTAPTLTHNYCAIKGSTSGYNETGQGTLRFSPINALDGDILHYVAILGDPNTIDENPQGVLDSFGISMGTASTNPFENFGSRQFTNAHIWSFRTLSDTGENQGYCLVDYIDVTPGSYLIQTTENSMTENDTNVLDSSFDKTRDSDKFFRAKTKTYSGQTLIPFSPIYYWSWTWGMSNAGVADFAELGTFSGVSNERPIRANTNATEGHTVAEAFAFINGSLVTPIPMPYTLSGEADVYLFFCNNPWPPLNVTTGNWSPWQDNDINCNVATAGSCVNTNYEFYYCRDQGTNNTYDDLPAISNEAIIRESSTSTDQDLLKEYYFFREETPDLSTTTLTLGPIPAVGGSIDISWDAFVATGGEVLDEFLVHYGTASGNYTNTVSIASTTYSSNITGLNNGQTYYFAITAVYMSGAESYFTNEISAVPVDIISPPAPVLGTTTSESLQIKIEWDPVPTASSYKVYWKAGSGCIVATDLPPTCYTSSYNVGNVTSATINELIFGTTYHFAVTAIDSSGNESHHYSNETNASPLALAPVIPGPTRLSQNTISSSTLHEEDSGIVAGVFEELDQDAISDSDDNRINLFGDIMKYIFKKLSYTITNKAEAQDINR